MPFGRTTFPCFSPAAVLLCGVVLACLTFPAAAGGGVGISVDTGDDPLRPTFVAPLPAAVAGQVAAGDHRPTKLLSVARLDEKTGDAGPAIFGTASVVDGTLRFQPEFRLSPGGRYRATLTLPGQAPLSIDHKTPAAADQKPATVERVYPSADHLPANLLKFYVYFSRPMRQTDRIFDQMHILNAEGKPVHDPWRRFQQWSQDGKRLTLWIHPGRVKRGVNLREDFGPVLVPGETFTLKLDAELEDLAGKPMASAFEKTFTATAEDRDRVDLAQWKLTSPKAGSRQPLRVTFAEPLDHALLGRLLTVRDGSGRLIDGSVAVGDHELTWSFTPASPWSEESYELSADTLLEDLAGNTPVRVFDTDMNKPVKKDAVTRLQFEPAN